MRCPSDIDKSDFDAMMKSLPDGLVFKKTTNHEILRDFWFTMTSDSHKKTGLKKGDTYVVSLIKMLTLEG